jgi:hypothetical protein
VESDGDECKPRKGDCEGKKKLQKATIEEFSQRRPVESL